MKEINDDVGSRATRVLAVMLAIALALVSIATGCGGGAGEGKGIKVAADILPLADFCREIGGGFAEVQALVPPGATPHAYELTSGQMKFLEEADILVTNGLELTPWADGILHKLGGEDRITVIAAEAIPRDELLAADGHGNGDGGSDGHGIYDPHVWLDPNLAIYMVEAIRDAFAEADHENAAFYRDNADRLIEELTLLDGDIRDTVSGLSKRRFIAFHSSWTYLAHRYGLEQVGVIEGRPGKEPSAGEIAALADMVDTMGVGAIFAEPQFSARAAEAIADESVGRVTVYVLDPLGDPGDPSRDSYLEMMRENLEVLKEALK